uniref:Proteasomal ubiquitin receptor ADRM1 homolog n=1 Tax=Panagrellus redivivus TaxID=6233 RepID=A0A7E4VT73_PANRE
MSVMFASNPANGRPSNGNLFEFRAGQARLEPGSTPEKRKVVSDKTKGLVYIKQSQDQLMHFYWKNRETNQTDLDLIIFPGDTEFLKVKECPDGRLFMLKFKNTSDERRLFWLQDPSKDRDDEIHRKTNDLLNNPPPQIRTGARGGMSERPTTSNLLASLASQEEGNALSNMDQNQLMQLFSLIQSGTGGGAKDDKGGAVDETTGSSDPVPAQIATGPTGLGDPDRTTPAAPKKTRIPAQKLRYILESYEKRNGRPATFPADNPNFKHPQIDLADVLSKNNVDATIEANKDRLKQHLPNQPPISQDDAELAATVSTPQFRQAASLFGAALQTGQMGPVLEQFDVNQEAVAAAANGNLKDFAKKLTISETANKGQNETDAQINAEAEAEESNESALAGPSAKKGKTDDDDNMDLD